MVAGAPATMVNGATSVVTIAPPLTTLCCPKRTPPRTMAPLAIYAPRSI